jgi:hypothetical protein
VTKDFGRKEHLTSNGGSTDYPLGGVMGVWGDGGSTGAPQVY